MSTDTDLSVSTSSNQANDEESPVMDYVANEETPLLRWGVLPYHALDALLPICLLYASPILLYLLFGSLMNPVNGRAFPVFIV